MQHSDVAAGRILIVDDDTELCALTHRFLAGEGFETEHVHSGEEGVQRALQVFSKWQPPAGSTFHQFVGRVDGEGGFAEGGAVADVGDGVPAAEPAGIIGSTICDGCSAS